MSHRTSRQDPLTPKGVRRAVPTVIVLGVLAAVGLAAGCWWARPWPYLAGLVLVAIIPAVLVHRWAYVHRLRAEPLISLGLGVMVLAAGILVPWALARPRASIRWTLPNGAFSCLRAAGDMVYVCRHHTLTAYDAATGAVAWHTKVGRAPQLRVTHDGRLLLKFWTGKTLTRTLLSTDGATLWTLSREPWVDRVLAYDHGVTVIVDGCDGACTMTGVDLHGHVAWRRRFAHAYEGLEDRPLWQSPSATPPVPQAVALTIDRRRGPEHVVVLDPADGTTVLDRAVIPLVSNEPVVVEDRVLVATRQAGQCGWALYRDGHRQWQHAGLCRGDDPYDPYRIIGDLVYVTAGDKVGVIDTATGQLRALRADEITARDPYPFRRDLLGDTAILAIRGQRLVATDPDTGDRLWTRNLDHPAALDASWSGSTLALSTDGSGHNPLINRACHAWPGVDCDHPVFHPVTLRLLDARTGAQRIRAYEPRGASAVTVGDGALFVVPDDRDRPAYLTGTTG